MHSNELLNTSRCDDCAVSAACLGTLASEAREKGCFGLQVVERGEHVYSVGDLSNCVYVLRRGALKTYVVSADGDEQILAFHSAGDLIGFDALSGGRQTRNTVALSHAEVCRLPIEHLNGGGDVGGVLHNRMLEGLNREIQRLQSMLKLDRLTAEQRICFFLVSQARRQGSDGGRYRVNLVMTRSEIGCFLDLATETVSRMFTRLQNLGLISVERHVVELLKLSELQDMARSTSSAGPTISHFRKPAVTESRIAA